MSSPPKANPFQAKIRKLYLKLFRSVKSQDAKLTVAKAFGTFAMQNYTGHFREPEIEDFLSDYNNERFKLEDNSSPYNEKVLIHIITKTFEIGGHSRFLENLLQLDDQHIDHLIVTDQGETQPRENIYTLIKQQKGTITHLEGSIDDKAKQLIKTVSALGGKIMLHHHPNDMIPSIALPIIKDRYPIFLFNHADHCYSFGFELDPIVINIRDEAARITYHYRGCQKNVVLPLPIIKPEINLSREEIFIKYGLDPDLKLGLCIGGMHKLTPSGEYNFFRTMKRALAENECLQIAVVGISESNLEELELLKYNDPRFHFLGTIKDPSELQVHAEIAIDPIPFGSYTADLETIYYGAYPLGTYDNPPLFDLTMDPALKGRFQMTKDEEEYLKQLKSALNTFDSNDQNRLKDIFCKHHCGQSWKKIFQTALQPIDVYDLLYVTTEFSSSYKLPAFSQIEDKVKYSFINSGVSVANDLMLHLKIIIAIQMIGASFTLGEIKPLLRNRIKRVNGLTS